MTIGEKIKQLREKAGYSQADLAKIIGVSKQAIGKYETGIVDNLPLNRVQQLAVVLGCSPEYLMGWPEKEKQLTENDELSQDKKDLIELVKTLSPEEVAAVLKILRR